MPTTTSTATLTATTTAPVTPTAMPLITVITDGPPHQRVPISGTNQRVVDKLAMPTSKHMAPLPPSQPPPLTKVVLTALPTTGATQRVVPVHTFSQQHRLQALPTVSPME
jgi:hypothetical protein